MHRHVQLDRQESSLELRLQQDNSSLMPTGRNDPFYKPAAGPLSSSSLAPPSRGSSPSKRAMAATAAAATAKSKNPTLSVRGHEALHRPPLLRCALFENQFSPSNPKGTINLGVAENSLCTEWLMDYFTKHFTLEYSDFTYGSALGGSVRLFAALQHLFSHYFHSHKPVLRSHVIAGTGCSSVIDLLVSCLADAGDGILVARPFYNGFSASFGCRNSVKAVGVELVPGEEAKVESISAYESTLVSSRQEGVDIKAVMLCNPHNPLGFCYSRSTLIGYCRFVEKHNLHLIVDEIYALSVFKAPDHPNAEPFTSILSIDVLKEAGCNPARIHAVYGASKDWGANGLRVGALVSQANEELHTAMESSCLLMKISSPADALWSGLLLDPIALPYYIHLNQTRLTQAYTLAVNFLQFHNIPYKPSNAGHFIFIDLRKYLPEARPKVGGGGHDFISADESNNKDANKVIWQTGHEREEELANRMILGGVILARGAAYSHPVPGFFRLTFTLRRDYFQIGLQRLETVLGLRRTTTVDLVRVPSSSSCCEDLASATEGGCGRHRLDHGQEGDSGISGVDAGNANEKGMEMGDDVTKKRNPSRYRHVCAGVVDHEDKEGHTSMENVDNEGGVLDSLSDRVGLVSL